MSVAVAEPAVKPIPEGFHTITPYLVVAGAAEAIEFYKRAFGAVELSRALTPDGTKIMNASIKIGDSIVMLNDEFPEMNCKGPLALGGSPFNLHLYVEDADAVFERAVAAGATITMPISDVFWGDRYGSVTDPFGHQWGIATHKREMTEADLKQMAADWENCTSEANQPSEPLRSDVRRRLAGRALHSRPSLRRGGVEGGVDLERNRPRLRRAAMELSW